jgi:hypothetical protein
MVSIPYADAAVCPVSGDLSALGGTVDQDLLQVGGISFLILCFFCVFFEVVKRR